MKPVLDIRRADDTSALFDFKCGVKSMDDFIHDPKDGLAKFIKLRLSNLWIVFEGDVGGKRRPLRDKNGRWKIIVTLQSLLKLNPRNLV